MKDLLIGAVDLYDWSKINNWAKSIRATGFDGDVVLLTYRLTNEAEVVAKATELNITLIKCEHDSFGRPLVHNQMNRDTICHQMRLFHIWQYLTQTDEQYRFVVTTDVRDVIFQSNPFTYLDKISDVHYDVQPYIVAASENILYSDEAWNFDNLLQGYGPYIAQHAKNRKYEVFNVGTLGGKSGAMADLCLLLYTMGQGRYIPNDQSSFGIVVNEGYMHDVWSMKMSQGWAFQCGSTIEPGRVVPQIEPIKDIYKLRSDGIVTLTNDTPYVILHQYDRVPELAQLVEARYA